MSALKTAKKFRSQQECLDFLEKRRWKDGVKCAYCKSSNVSKHTEEGQTSRFQCSSCRKSFSVLVGTIFEASKLSLLKWFMAISLMVEAKKGISALQLSRHLDVNYKTAWSISHKIRKAMKENNQELFAGIVQMDETYIKTKKDDDDKMDGGSKKKLNNTPVVAMSNDGKITAMKVDNIQGKTLLDIALSKAQIGSTFHTDSSFAYASFKEFFNHQKVKHAVEFVSKNKVHTNGVETFWSLLKRGIRGNFHHISKKYLQDYINEFQFRFNRRAFKSEVIFDDILNGMLGV